MLSEALNACGREMVLSLSPGPALVEKAELYKQISNMWRITDEAVLKMHANSRNARQIFRREIDGKEFILWIADISAHGAKVYKI